MEKKTIDQKEYLKKYLSSNVGDDKKKKKKKKKTNVGAKTVNIIDDDIDLKNMRPIDDNEFDIFIDTEDAPQIAGIVDERGQIDFADKKRWKVIADDEGGDVSFASSTKDRMKDKGNDIRNSREISKKGSNKHGSDDDFSPPRKQRNRSDDDLSPPRISKSSKEKKQLSKGISKAAIVRDRKTGRKRNLEAEAAEEREKQKRQKELDEKYVKWGKGLKQVEDRQQQLQDDLYEMSKPLARYADDADLDKHLREQDREGDPMLDYIKQKQIKEGKRQPDRPRYEGSFMPNRFGIKPGHRWDGVDRSNGYEKKWFEAQNAKVAVQEEAYKWSTSDM